MGQQKRTDPQGESKKKDKSKPVVTTVKVDRRSITERNKQRRMERNHRQRVRAQLKRAKRAMRKQWV